MFSSHAFEVNLFFLVAINSLLKVVFIKELTDLQNIYQFISVLSLKVKTAPSFGEWLGMVFQVTEILQVSISIHLSLGIIWFSII